MQVRVIPLGFETIAELQLQEDGESLALTE
jgi:hypothetical protein